MYWDVSLHFLSHMIAKLLSFLWSCIGIHNFQILLTTVPNWKAWICQVCQLMFWAVNPLSCPVLLCIYSCQFLWRVLSPNYFPLHGGTYTSVWGPWQCLVFCMVGCPGERNLYLSLFDFQFLVLHLAVFQQIKSFHRSPNRWSSRLLDLLLAYRGTNNLELLLHWAKAQKFVKRQILIVDLIKPLWRFHLERNLT